MKIVSVVGARPNFMKVAPLHRSFQARPDFASKIIHTGQHYDARMSDIFFRQLEMPEPDVYLGVGSGSHAEQTARVMIGFEEVVLREQPDLVLVVGDVNSTMACSLVAAKLHIPVAHVEAGLRSGDRRMPEEINRLVTDSISDYLFVTEQDGLDNLKREGVAEEKIYFTGNVMIDSLVYFREKAAQTSIMADLGVDDKGFVLVTMHRPSNVDTVEGLQEVLRILENLSESMPVVFPMHPRTRNRFQVLGLEARLLQLPRLIITEPLGYLQFLRLMEGAAVVITDSGGVQEETTYLQVPCLTLRESTERPVTVTLGTNELLPVDTDVVSRRVEAILAGQRKKASLPPLWDGHAAERIADVLQAIFVPTR